VHPDGARRDVAAVEGSVLSGGGDGGEGGGDGVGVGGGHQMGTGDVRDG
jgi:hypothetical protein